METALSILTLTAFLWVVAFLLPKAAKEKDAFALICAILTMVLALFIWFVAGITRVF